MAINFSLLYGGQVGEIVKTWKPDTFWQAKGDPEEIVRLVQVDHKFDDRYLVQVETLREELVWFSDAEFNTKFEPYVEPLSRYQVLSHGRD